MLDPMLPGSKVQRHSGVPWTPLIKFEIFDYRMSKANPFYFKSQEQIIVIRMVNFLLLFSIIINDLFKGYRSWSLRWYFTQTFKRISIIVGILEVVIKIRETWATGVVLYPEDDGRFCFSKKPLIGSTVVEFRFGLAFQQM